MAKICTKAIEKIARVIASAPESAPLNFYSVSGKDGKEIVLDKMYPALDHAHAVEFFFFAIMNDYGFWYGDVAGYHAPLFGTMGSKSLKGSDLLWRSCMIALGKDAEIFSAKHLANITPKELAEVFSDDNGPIPWPDFEERFIMARSYGEWFLRNNSDPAWILECVNARPDPLKLFLIMTKAIPGYDRDKSFVKKNILLAMALSNRPERFLKVRADADWPAIVDYHLMRLALRTGMVELDPQEATFIKERAWVSAIIEHEIRYHTKIAIEVLVRASGKNMSQVDFLCWSARRYCPETEAPKCTDCVFKSACAKRTELFQPVLRTSSY